MQLKDPPKESTDANVRNFAVSPAVSFVPPRYVSFYGEVRIFCSFVPPRCVSSQLDCRNFLPRLASLCTSAAIVVEVHIVLSCSTTIRPCWWPAQEVLLRGQQQGTSSIVPSCRRARSVSRAPADAPLITDRPCVESCHT